MADNYALVNKQYVGARYVPKFSDPIAWDINRSYEPLTIVTYLNNSYTSKVPVPVGVDITNEEYWVVTGNYNAQVEEYRQEVINVSQNLDALKTKVKNLVFNVLDYGCKNDGLTDNYNALKTLLDVINTNGGGILYFPNGKYLTTNTIPIPDNTSVIGQSKKAIIYYDGTLPWFGCAIAVCGSHISIENISVEYIENDKTYFKTGSQLGGIGIATNKYQNGVNIDKFALGDIFDIIINNVYSPNTSPIQIENDSPNYENYSVIVKNCYFPNGSINISPTQYNNQKNILIDGCTTKAIRDGYNEQTQRNLIITNCHTGWVKILDSNVIMSNCVIYNTNDIRIMSNNVISNVTYGLELIGKNIIINDCLIQAKVNNNNTGIFISNMDITDNICFSNVFVQNFTSSYLDQKGVNATFTGCHFDSSNISITGKIINSKIDYNPLGFVYSYDKSYMAQPSLAAGILAYSSANNLEFTVLGLLCYVHGGINIDTVSVGKELFTVPERFKPIRTTNFFIKEINGNADLVVEIDTNGVCKITSLLGGSELNNKGWNVDIMYAIN